MGSGLTMKNTSVVGNVIGEAYPVEAFDVFAVLSAGVMCASSQDCLPIAFALAREATKRQTGMFHYDVQIEAAIATFKLSTFLFILI